MIWLHIITLFLYSSGVFCDFPGRPKNVPCKKDDVRCITKVVQWIYDSVISGAPELGIETSDPLYQELIQGKMPYVKFEMKKNNIEGFKTCKINQARINSDISNMHMDLICRRFHIDGEYNIDGKLLHYPIKGEGAYYVDATNYHLTLDNELKFYKKNGNLHLMYKSFKFTAAMLGELDIDMQNLFGGKKELAEPIIKFAKENGKLFTSLLHDPIITANIKKFMKSFNMRLKSIPVTELLEIDD